MEWEIGNSIIMMKMEDGSTIVPSASEVFSIVFKSSTKLSSYPDLIVPDPREKLPEITFSKTGLNIKGRISWNSSRSLYLEFFVEYNGIENILQIEHGHLVDHIIVGNTWFHLTQHTDLVIRILESAGLSGSGRISFAQYLALKKVLEKNETLDVEDRAVNGIKSWDAHLAGSGLSSTFIGQLYPYQLRGYEWLKYMTNEECGCILGDEMGLGKTVQVIALIDWRKKLKTTPALVIVPVSLIENWKRELTKFAPALNVLIHRGANRTGFYTTFLNYDVVLTSYDVAVGDLSMMKMIRWDLVVTDESQNIKNPSAIRTRSIKQIPRRVAIAITGTPFENHMTDLWSIMDFILPGYLGSLEEFNETIPDEIEGARIIEPLISPLLLRRTVKEVAQDLPEKIYIPQVVEMDNKEADEYERVRNSIIVSYHKGGASLAMLQKLRMYCTHPFIIDNQQGDPARFSGKYRRLCEIIEEIIANGEKFIIFTSFNNMVSILVEDLPIRYGIRAWYINGAIPVETRQSIIDEFTDFFGPSVIVLNPKAAGVGLNITAANHIIHYNPEWNPAVEDQASARAYRRGQTRNVTIHRLFYAYTVEDIINQRIEKKRDMFNIGVVGTEGNQDNLDDIIKALKITPFRR